MRERRPLLQVCALLVVLALLACQRAEGPAPVAWDRTRCAHCGMLVSEPAWAAQQHTADGRVLHYDDPGCLLVSLAPQRAGEASTLYFHHASEARWLTGDAVRFVAAARDTPMGYGLAAVAAGEADGALSLEAARERALARDRERTAPPAGERLP